MKRAISLFVFILCVSVLMPCMSQSKYHRDLTEKLTSASIEKFQLNKEDGRIIKAAILKRFTANAEANKIADKEEKQAEYKAIYVDWIKDVSVVFPKGTDKFEEFTKWFEQTRKELMNQ